MTKSFRYINENLERLHGVFISYGPGQALVRESHICALKIR